MGSWTGAPTDGHISEKTIFRNPLPRLKSNKKGIGKNTHAFCHANKRGREIQKQKGKLRCTIKFGSCAFPKNALTGGKCVDRR